MYIRRSKRRKGEIRYKHKIAIFTVGLSLFGNENVLDAYFKAFYIHNKVHYNKIYNEKKMWKRIGNILQPFTYIVRYHTIKYITKSKFGNRKAKVNSFSHTQ